ncbi:hypothetical protein [Nonomuraea sp. NPDC050783]|uniref:hypothetical protein n=1 Tax=Nonomuraea sp. NPDC050783 TaxID=3154634 RepID=UPI003467689F
MYALVRRYRMGRGTVEDLMNTVATRFAAQISAPDVQAPVRVPDGIVSYQAIDTGNGTIATITVFATEQQCRQAEQGATDIRLSLADFAVEETDTFSGPVMISKEAG